MKLTTIKSEDYHLNASTEEVRRILENALNGHQITREEALHLMQAKEPKDLFALFSAANEIKKQHFGNRVFLYGFVYFSTYCRNQCTFCFYRKPNTKPVRYRKEAEEILKVSRLLKDSGVHLIDLTMGEDPLIHEEHRYDLLLNLARTVKEDLDIPVMVSPGILPQHVLEELGKGNVDWYALYQETYNRALFSSLRLNQDYDARMKAKVSA
jgi:methylornithine synthase